LWMRAKDTDEESGNREWDAGKPVCIGYMTLANFQDQTEIDNKQFSVRDIHHLQKNIAQSDHGHQRRLWHIKVRYLRLSAVMSRIAG
jgi:hypothetical protein